jgi:Tol biopolymer transport system component
MLLALWLLLAQAAPRPAVTSYLCTYDVKAGKERVVWSGPRHVEAPNWSPDGKWLVVNSGGQLWRIPAQGGELEAINTGEVRRINNDHGITPDGKRIIISAGQIYVLPFNGGTPRQVTTETPSYYHGVSPDGRTLAICAKRGDNFDLYAISIDGGPEKRLTAHPGYDDGPDYTPDGKWIWFNSDRSGTWDLWRIPAAGGDDQAERITSDAREDWFPHPSPDGKSIVYVSFEPGTKGHPANQTVQLHLMDAATRRSRVLQSLFGGQGTINVNSWAPDSRRFAYVRYQLEGK